MSSLISDCIDFVVQLCLHTSIIAKKLKNGDDLLSRFEDTKARLLTHQEDIHRLETEPSLSHMIKTLRQSLLEASELTGGLRDFKRIESKYRKQCEEWCSLIEKNCQSLLTSVAIKLADASKREANKAVAGTKQLALASGLPECNPVDEDEANRLCILASKYLFGLGVAQSNEFAFQRFLSAARCGLADACNMVGSCYEKGVGTAPDLSAAVVWYTKAAKKEHPEALNALGRLYESGLGTSEDLVQAVKFYQRAVDLNHADAQTNLGYIYENGLLNGVPDYIAAAKLYRRAAAQGHARALNNLGSLHYSGKCGQVKFSEAVECYRKGALLGHAPSQNNLGICYEEGHGVPRDMTMAKQLYRQAAQQEYPSAMNNLGYLLMVDQQYDEAENLFRLAAAKGSVDALYNIGTMYQQGLCLDGVNYTAAFQYFLRAAELNHAKAMCSVAMMFCQGQGTDLSPEEGATYYRMACDLGEEEAMLNYAEMLENGFGVEVNDTEAIMWYKKAREIGSEEANRRLQEKIQRNRQGTTL